MTAILGSCAHPIYSSNAGVSCLQEQTTLPIHSCNVWMYLECVCMRVFCSLLHFFMPAGLHTNVLSQEKHVLILGNLHAMLCGCSVIPVDVEFYSIMSWCK